MIDCRHCRELLVEVNSGLSEVPEAEAITEHLQACISCTHFARELEQTLGLLGQHAVPEMPDMFWSSMERSIMTRIAENDFPKRRWAYFQVLRERALVFRHPFQWQPLHALAMITLIVVLSGGLYFFRGPAKAPELTLATAAALCDDPHIWASLPWGEFQEKETITNTGAVVAGDEGDDEVVATLSLLEDTNGPTGNNQELSSEEPVWSLLDGLDDQGYQMLIAEFALQENA